MKKLLFLFTLFFALAFWHCEKDQALYDSPLQEKGITITNVDARSSECDLGMVPIKGELLEELDFSEVIICTDPNNNPVGPPFAKTTRFISGNLSHLGTIDTEKSGTLRVSCTNFGDGLLEGYIQAYIVAANGDGLYLDIFLTFDQGLPDRITWTIVGGSGRFENASGYFITTFETVPVDGKPPLTRLRILEGCMTPPGISKHISNGD
ncbi:MAG: dirigent protein [Saprospiraceae bacterium]|nr:dirigent protein [Saprospiraceae bacterium]